VSEDLETKPPSPTTRVPNQRRHRLDLELVSKKLPGDSFSNRPPKHIVSCAQHQEVSRCSESRPHLLWILDLQKKRTNKYPGTFLLFINTNCRRAAGTDIPFTYPVCKPPNHSFLSQVLTEDPNIRRPGGQHLGRPHRRQTLKRHQCKQGDTFLTLPRRHAALAP